jgi:uncharacterized membrane protein
MNMGDLIPGAGQTWAAIFILAPLLLLGLATAPWKALLARRERQNALGAAIVLLPLLWSMSPELGSGPRLQLLGMTTVTLMFGWQLAVVAGLISGVVLTVVGNWSVLALPVNLLLTVAVPVLVTLGVLWAADHLKRSNLFVYMLGVAFGGSMLSILASFLVGTWLFQPGLDHAVVLLVTFPEGFLNGTLISAFAVFYPDMVKTYDDVRYLGKPR